MLLGDWSIAEVHLDGSSGDPMPAITLLCKAPPELLNMRRIIWLAGSGSEEGRT
ncbi:uncharacterized protein FOMMEDRAFT_159558 [Fomitiporia mediterranea MF3/22]|uniref:uncharacterized protein n=1 Tax=Fomitiporia mediterranea (strain MF3/22) TaxID=694068 RepID=UPI0004408B58|nr:uncharacterized protein FOMMEDRAFT_159558 [Fomitiporia mediterranea MF3/22]EJC99980.1 hypothetical protein FOMMEDRAFT_159558 [Fomitiporia mediterranea MF3/22]